MTVDELLRKLANAYTAFDAKRVEAWRPVFKAAFGRREGPHLAEAYNACLVSFDPKKTGKLFPTPPDIEQHMPSIGKPADPNLGKPIRAMLEQRGRRSKALIAGWLGEQGAKVKAQRHPELYAACFLEAASQCTAKALDDRVTAIVLDKDQIRVCFQSALSNERNRRHGPVGRYNAEAWWAQLEEIAGEWKLDITPEWWSDDAAKTLSRKEAA
jgi:hypothetical protein